MQTIIYIWFLKCVALLIRIHLFIFLYIIIQLFLPMSLTIKYQKSTLTGLIVIAVFLLAAAVLICIMALKNIGYLYVGLAYLALCGVYVYIFVRELKKSKYEIVLSPEGIRYDDGKMIPMEDIDHCFMRYSESREEIASLRGQESTVEGRWRMVVVRKDRTKVFIDMSPYKFKKVGGKTFHEKVNELPGLPKFTAPVLDDILS